MKNRQYWKIGATVNWKGRSTLPFERLALSKDKKGVLQLAEKGHIVTDSTEAIKDPYVLDFSQITSKSSCYRKSIGTEDY